MLRLAPMRQNVFGEAHGPSLAAPAIPLTRDALDIPTVASGGFGDGRGLVAALALGADGMNMGTRFVATQECPVHDNVKQALMAATERDTQLLMRTLRNTARYLANENTAKVLENESRGGATIDDIKGFMSGLEGKKMIEAGDMSWRGVFRRTDHWPDSRRAHGRRAVRSHHRRSPRIDGPPASRRRAGRGVGLGRLIRADRPR